MVVRGGRDTSAWASNEPKGRNYGRELGKVEQRGLAARANPGLLVRTIVSKWEMIFWEREGESIRRRETVYYIPGNEKPKDRGPGLKENERVVERGKRETK